MASIKRTVKQERKLARERLKTMPKWFRQMIKDLGLRPETVQFSMSTPVVQKMQHAGSYAVALEHTGEVSITIHGFR